MRYVVCLGADAEQMYVNCGCIVFKYRVCKLNPEESIINLREVRTIWKIKRREFCSPEWNLVIEEIDFIDFTKIKRSA